MRSRGIDDFTYWLIRDRIPLVKLLILSNVVTFFLIALGQIAAIPEYLAYGSGKLMTMPWVLLTHPLVGLYPCCANGMISLLFLGYWLWIAGGSLERSWGTARFATYFFTMSAMSAIGLLVGTLATRVPTSAGNLWLPIAGVTVAFAALNPEQQILVFFLFPLKLKYLAAFTAAAVLVIYSRSSVVIGLLALVGCAYSYWYVRSGRSVAWTRRPALRGQVVRVHRGKSALRWLNPLNWYREYRDRKRLRDLFDR